MRPIGLMNIELRVWCHSPIFLCQVAKNSIVKQLGSVYSLVTAIEVPVAKTLPKVNLGSLYKFGCIRVVVVYSLNPLQRKTSPKFKVSAKTTCKLV